MDANDLVEGMTLDTARRYMAVRQAIEVHADTIHALGRLMAAFAEVDEEAIRLSPQVVSRLGELIALEAEQIIGRLDEGFVHIADLDWSMPEWCRANARHPVF